MAYWQNGKVYVYTGTQSTAQTVMALARWLNLDPDKIAFVSEYTGGGFGSKVTGGISMIIPALLSKKANAPVMMRISREEEHFIGRARPSFVGRMKVGFSRAGRITVHGKPPNADTGAMAGRLAIDGAVPLQFNAYKIPLMRNLVKRAIGGVEEATW